MILLSNIYVVCKDYMRNEKWSIENNRYHIVDKQIHFICPIFANSGTLEIHFVIRKYVPD